MDENAEFVRKITNLELSLSETKSKNVALVNANLVLTLELNRLQQVVAKMNESLSSALVSLGEATSSVLDLKTNLNISPDNSSFSESPSNLFRSSLDDLRVLKAGLTPQQLYTIRNMTKEREVFLSPIVEVETPPSQKPRLKRGKINKKEYLTSSQYSTRSPVQNFFRISNKVLKQGRPKSVAQSPKSDLPLKRRLRQKVAKSYQEEEPTPKKSGTKARSKKRPKKTNPDENEVV